MSVKALRNGAIVSFLVALGLLFIGGWFALDKVPPIPDRILGPDGPASDQKAIMGGQHVYQKFGLMDHGSVWGHGSLRGMDFAASSLHRLGEHMRDFHAGGQSGAFGRLGAEEQGRISQLVIAELRLNRYDPASGTLTLTASQRYGLEQLRAYWDQVFSQGDKRYGFLPDTVADPEQRRELADFFFWTAWAAGTQRPDADYTYTNNWPPDRSVGNDASPETMLWTVLSLLALFVVLGLIIYIVHRYRFFYGEEKGVQAGLKLLELPVTPSQLSAAKYFLVAGLLFVVQIFNGGLLAHYTVDPATFYIPFVGELIPYSWAKTWHLQLAIFWIAISWIGTAIVVAPMIAGREPRHQRLLVNILFVAAFLVVVGSLTGEVLGIKDMLGDLWFWFGHQGWEYLELGRVWQILLFGGLIFWLFVVYRPLAGILKRDQDPSAAATETAAVKDRRALILFYLLSAIFVVAFFGFGLTYGPDTHLSIADYWRWFVVHIWVEGIFEFFGVAITALFLVSLGLVSAQSALRVAYLTAILVFLSGIPGTAHHYFWYGGPSFWLAIGGVFSSLEPVPLILLVTRAWMEYRSIRQAGRKYPYRWPLYFLTASSFWNFLGAGVFGFLINLPIINYYEHATYLTSNHGHTALFGVYGMLAISLILFSWRSLVANGHWNDRILKLSFWGLNGGLFLMFSTSLLPVGLKQLWHSYQDGFWYARSAEFYDQPMIQALGTWRMVPDAIIILLGALPLLWFLVSTYFKLRKPGEAQSIEEFGSGSEPPAA
jgi:nitric oxide reductase subunit B